MRELIAPSLARLGEVYPSEPAYLEYVRAMPFLRGHWSPELEEAALVDGCSRLGSLVRIILPMSLPALAVVAFFSFTQSWNEFLYALVFITDGRLRTLPVGLASFITGDVYGWGYLMSGAVLTTLPVIAAYIYLQKYMVEGLTAGGVKG